jgi:catechol 2,3-dioxygenase-like lactoylglutathione lyase family enzyme
MKCLRLLHVNVRVERLDDAVRFYTQVMGLEPIERRDSKGAWFGWATPRSTWRRIRRRNPPKRHFAVKWPISPRPAGPPTAWRRDRQEEAGRF